MGNREVTKLFVRKPEKGTYAQNKGRRGAHKLCSGCEDSSVGLDALNHRKKTIGTSGREMLTESDGLHKIKVGVTDFFSGDH